MKRTFSRPLFGLALAFLAGCTTGSLPPGAQVVGGGLKINWSSPVAGTAILIEKTTGKTIATESLSGNNFTFDADSDGDVLKAVLGEMPANAQFVLYFVPDRR